MFERKTGFNVDTCARCLAEKITDDEYNIDHKVGENARFRPADVFAPDAEEGCLVCGGVIWGVYISSSCVDWRFACD